MANSFDLDGILKKYAPTLKVGSLDTKKQAAPPTPPATPEPAAAPKQAAPLTKKAQDEESEPMDSFGSLIPYADPSWYQTVRS